MIDPLAGLSVFESGDDPIVELDSIVESLDETISRLEINDITERELRGFC